jgi:hypothetical protein
MAMPWKRAKAIAAALRGEGAFPDGYTGSRTLTELNALFDACFRIQREASAALGRHVPMVVENVKGAQPWVGKAKANFGSYYLWGDVAMVGKRIVRPQPEFGEGLLAPGRANGQKVPGFNFHQHENGGAGGSFQTAAVKGVGGGWFHGERNDPRDVRKNAKGEWVNRDGVKFGGGWWLAATNSLIRSASSRSAARKHASAVIAKILRPLSEHIARMFTPAEV